MKDAGLRIQWSRQCAGRPLQTKVAEQPHFGIAQAAHDMVGVQLLQMVKPCGLHQLVQRKQTAPVKAAHMFGFVEPNRRVLVHQVLGRDADQGAVHYQQPFLQRNADMNH